jgi:hypothetical protein
VLVDERTGGDWKPGGGLVKYEVNESTSSRGDVTNTRRVLYPRRRHDLRLSCLLQFVVVITRVEL